MNLQSTFQVPLARFDNALGGKSIGTITISFNQPVTNPRLQVNGIDSGGVGGTATEYTALDQQLDVLTPGITLEKISGLDRYNVSGTSMRVIPNEPLGFRASGTLQLTGTFSTVQLAIGLEARAVGVDPSGVGTSIPDAKFTVTVDQDLTGGTGGLPASYGAASHVVGPATIGPSVTPDNQTTLTLGPPVPVQAVDANDAVLDLSGLGYAAAGSTYTLDVPVDGVPPGPGMPLTGWIDFDRDGLFGAGELATETVPPGATQVSLQWAAPANLTSGPTWARFRLGASDGLPTGFGAMGEVEDVPVTVLSSPPVILGPTEGQVVTTPLPTLSGTAEPGTSVTIRDGDGVLLCADVVVTAEGTWSCTPVDPLPDGPVTLLGTTTGPGGTSAESAPRSFVIDTTTDLEIAKVLVDATTPIAPGEQFDYLLTATNLGPDTAGEVVISDTLPAGLTFVGSTPAGCTSAAQVVTCPPVETLAPGASTSVTLTAQLSPDYSGDGSDLGNIASVSSAGVDPNPDNNTTDPVLPPPIAAASADLSVTKTAPVDAVSAGEETAWSITVANAGPSDAVGVVVTDVLETGLSFVSDDLGLCSAAGQTVTCEVGTVPAGTSVTVVVTTLVVSDTASGTVFENAASASSTTPDPDPDNNTSPPVTAPPVTTSADLSVTKTAPTDAVSAGGQTAWSITVANAGPSDAVGVVVTDVLETGLSFVSDDLGLCSAAGQTVTCEVGAVAAGSSATVVVTTAVGADVAAGTVFENAASVSATTPDPDPDNNTSPPVTAPPVEASADLSVTKTAPVDAVSAGEETVWSITVANAGPSEAAGVVVTDTLQTGLSFVSDDQGLCSAAGQVVTCDIGVVASGASTTVAMTTRVNADVAAGTVFENAASVSATTPDVDPDNNTSPPVTAPPVTTSADLSVTKTASVDAVSAGEETAWSITVANAGPSDAVGVVVTDDLETGLSFVSDDLGVCSAVGQVVTCEVGAVAAGSSATVVVTTAVGADVAAGTVFENAASVSATTPDPDPDNNTSPPVTAPPVTTSADLSVTKTAPTDAVIAGGQAAWSIMVANAGPSDALGVVVTDTLQAELSFVSDDLGVCSAVGQVVTCEVGAVAAGSSATVVVTTAVGADVAAGTVFENAASVSATTPDPDPDNNTSPPVAAPPVEASADLSVTKTAPTDAVIAGGQAAWSIMVANAGPSDALGVVVTDTLQAGLSFVSDDLGICSAVGQVVTCEVGAVAAGSSATVVVTTAVGADVAAGTVFEKAASASSTTPDPDPDNNTSPPVTAPPVEVSADLSVTKTAPVDAVSAGEETAWSITVANAGPSDAVGVVVTDVLETGLSFVSDDLGLCSAAGQTVTCEVGTVPAGTSVTVVVTTLVVSDTASGTVFENAASASSTTPDPDPDNNTSPPVTAPPVTASADLSVTKTAPTDTVIAGGMTSWSITVANAGPSDAVGVVVTDTLEAGLTFVADDLGLCSAAGQTVTCELGTVAAGGSATVVLTTAVGADVEAGTLFENAASASTTTPDPNPDDNTSPPVTAPPVVTSSDVSIMKIPPATVAPGETIEWVLVARNVGPSAATGVVVTDVPESRLTFVSDDLGICESSGGIVTCQVGDLGVDESVEIVLTTLVGLDVPVGDSVVNSASIESDAPDPDLSNNETGLVFAPANPEADLSVTKEAALVPPLAGASTEWTITVVNAGPVIARDVVLSDTLPTGLTFSSDAQGLCSADGLAVTCALGDLAPGSVTEVVLSTDVVQSLSPGTILENSAAVRSATPDPEPDNNGSTATAPPSQASADLATTKAAADAPPVAGGLTSWTISVHNAGPSQARGVLVEDVLPDGLSFVSDDGGLCSAVEQVVTCEIGTVDAGGTAVVVLTTLVASDVPAGSVVENAASASALTPDPNPGDNTSDPARSGLVETDADLAVTVVVGPEMVHPGDVLDYELRLTNDGPSSAVGVLADVLSADLATLLSAGEAGQPVGRAVFALAGRCTSGAVSVAVTCEVVDLAPGDSVVIPVQVQVDADASPGAVIDFVGRVRATTADSVPGNNTDSDSVEVVAADTALPTPTAPPASSGPPVAPQTPPAAPHAPAIPATGADVVVAALLALLLVALGAGVRRRRGGWSA